VLNNYSNDPDPQQSASLHEGVHKVSLQPRIIPRSSHNLSRKLIDEDVLKVLYRLKSRGFVAYLVGGCVRDILLKRTPKDFDVCTDATPSQVRRIFRNCRLIGRRFRLAHILFGGNKIVDVSTFRREPDVLPDTDDRRELAILSNQYYGTPADDAYRRDFTINALFYDVRDFSIIDYVGGIEDLERRLIRVIGDPRRRFYEDPVRMMRGMEFAARLGFSLDQETFLAIREYREEIRHGSPERIKEEIMAILVGGYARRCFSLFIDTGLFSPLFSGFQPYEEETINALLNILGQVDASISAGHVPSEYLCLAAFLWPFISSQLARKEIRHLNDLDPLLRDLINPFCHHFNIQIHYPRRSTGWYGE